MPDSDSLECLDNSLSNWRGLPLEAPPVAILISGHAHGRNFRNPTLYAPDRSLIIIHDTQKLNKNSTASDF